MKKEKKEINIVANTMVEPGMSGGNRIFIENAKRWVKKGSNLRVFTSSVGKKICCLSGLCKVEYITWKVPLEKKKLSVCEIVYLYFLALINGWVNLLKVNFKKGEIVYSSSDYWPDSLPVFLVKLLNPKVIWVAGFYLFAPKPWQKNSPYKGKRLFIGLFYWLTQLPIYWIIKRYADIVFVTSEPDVERFVTFKRKVDKILVIRGGVDIRPSEKYLFSGNTIPLERKMYDACFVGRFHPQKGVLELVDIWKNVCERKPEAKLAMIGIGSLENEVREKITNLKLKENIELLGFKDGEEKFQIFKQSKIIIHPAIFDSGGMAACEAMAWGLPGVSFDLEALKTYYPKGMLKTPCFNIDKFADNIINLLVNKILYKKTKEDAISWAREWDWDKRGNMIYQKLLKISKETNAVI